MVVIVLDISVLVVGFVIWYEGYEVVVCVFNCGVYLIVYVVVEIYLVLIWLLLLYCIVFVVVYVYLVDIIFSNYLVLDVCLYCGLIDYFVEYDVIGGVIYDVLVGFMVKVVGVKLLICDLCVVEMYE